MLPCSCHAEVKCTHLLECEVLELELLHFKLALSCFADNPSEGKRFEQLVFIDANSLLFHLLCLKPFEGCRIVVA